VCMCLSVCVLTCVCERERERDVFQDAFLTLQHQKPHERLCLCLSPSPLWSHCLSLYLPVALYLSLSLSVLFLSQVMWNRRISAATQTRTRWTIPVATTLGGQGRGGEERERGREGPADTRKDTQTHTRVNQGSEASAFGTIV